MKKVWLLLLPAMLLAASLETFEEKMFRGLLEAIAPNRIIHIWVDDDRKRSLFKHFAHHIRLADSAQKADLVIAFKKLDHILDKPVIAGRYSLIENYRNRCVAAFYWKKGRPHLLFFRHNLEKFDLSVPEIYKKYIVDRP